MKRWEGSIFFRDLESSLRGELADSPGALNVSRRGEHALGDKSVREVTTPGDRLKKKGGGEELNHERGQGWKHPRSPCR